MKYLHKIALVVLLFASQGATAQPNATRIEDFAFLSGYWIGEGMGGQSEEIWMPPSGGRMFGIFKQSDSSGLIFTEFMEITEVDGKFILRLKHFNPDFSGWEGKTEHLTFALSDKSATGVDFGSLRYKVNESDVLLIELDMRQTAGAVKTETFVLNRVSN